MGKGFAGKYGLSSVEMGGEEREDLLRAMSGTGGEDIYIELSEGGGYVMLTPNPEGGVFTVEGEYKIEDDGLYLDGTKAAAIGCDSIVFPEDEYSPRITYRKS